MSATIEPPHPDIWFDAGEAVFLGSTDPVNFPPMDDREAQRWWAGGFAVAWMENPTTRLGGLSLQAALAIVLEERSELHALIRARSAWDDDE